MQSDGPAEQLSAGLVRSDSVGSASSLKGRLQNSVYAVRNFHRGTVNLDKDPVFKAVKADESRQLFSQVFRNPSGASEEELAQLNKSFSSVFQGITWFTYRDAIQEPLVDSSIRSDAGWGCMLRTG